MTDDKSNVYPIRPSTVHDAKPLRERRWFEVWKEVTPPRSRGEPRLAPSKREHFAYHVKPLKRRFEQAGKSFEAAMQEAAGRSRATEQRRKRRLPPKEGRADSKKAVRSDRFVIPASGRTDRLCAYASEWLFLVEVLAEGIGADYQHEVDKFWHSDPPPKPSSGVMSQYEAVFSELAGKLTGLAAEVARKFEVSSYYECCDRMGAYMRNGAIVEDDGVGMHFERHEFDFGLWKEFDVDRIGSGDALADMLVHVPLGRQRLATMPTKESEWIGFEVAIFLGLCSAYEKPEDSPSLLIAPRLIRYLPEQERYEPLWTGEGGKLSNELLEHARGRFRTFIQELAPHLDDVRCERLTGANCSKWLSLGQPPGDDFVDTALWDDFPGTVSAPVGTLAAYIQSNLAYADTSGKPELRLDRLLEAEAQGKIEQLRALLDSKGAEYRAAMRLAFANDHLKSDLGETND